MKRWTTSLLLVAAVFTGAMFGAGIAVYLHPAIASRNSSGTYSSASSPVTTLQTISTSLWNNTFADLATGVTDSLDRNGRGGMLAALRGTDGTVAAPAFAYTSETGSGEYRIGAGDLGWAILGGKKLELTGSLFTVTPAASFSSTLALADVLTQTIAGTASSIPLTSYEASLANGNAVNWILGAAGSNNSSGAIVYTKNATAANSTLCLSIFGQTSTLCVDGNNKTTTGGSLTIGASGTAIAAVYRASSSLTPSSIAANACQTIGSTITVTGAATGDQCTISTVGPTSLAPFCYVLSSNTVQPYFCNPGTGSATPASGTYTATVIH